ncbi:hypothetical protein RKD18_000364 [Streptomyces phaeoluteigriseus]
MVRGSGRCIGQEADGDEPAGLNTSAFAATTLSSGHVDVLDAEWDGADLHLHVHDEETVALGLVPFQPSRQVGVEIVPDHHDGPAELDVCTDEQVAVVLPGEAPSRPSGARIRGDRLT